VNESTKELKHLIKENRGSRKAYIAQPLIIMDITLFWLIVSIIKVTTLSWCSQAALILRWWRHPFLVNNSWTTTSKDVASRKTILLCSIWDKDCNQLTDLSITCKGLNILCSPVPFSFQYHQIDQHIAAQLFYRVHLYIRNKKRVHLYMYVCSCVQL
jgi:hypothetical protein